MAVAFCPDYQTSPALVPLLRQRCRQRLPGKGNLRYFLKKTILCLGLSFMSSVFIRASLCRSAHTLDDENTTALQHSVPPTFFALTSEQCLERRGAYHIHLHLYLQSYFSHADDIFGFSIVPCESVVWCF